MIYSYHAVTPANRAATNPVHSVLNVTKGLVYRIEVEFPPGSAGLCHLVICDGLYQVWPSTPGDTFNSDANTIAFDDTYLKLNAPFQFDIYTYNLDDTYEHIPHVRIGLVSQEIFMARFLPSYSWKYFIEQLEALQKEQEEKHAGIIENPFTWMLTD